MPDRRIRKNVFDRLENEHDFVQFINRTRKSDTDPVGVLYERLPREVPAELVDPDIDPGSQQFRDLVDKTKEQYLARKRRLEQWLGSKPFAKALKKNESADRVFQLMLNETEADLISILSSVGPERRVGEFWTLDFHDTGLTRAQAYQLLDNFARDLFLSLTVPSHRMSRRAAADLVGGLGLEPDPSVDPNPKRSRRAEAVA